MPVCLWAKDSEPNTKEKAFFDAINNVKNLSQRHLENEYGADLESPLSSPFYCKQEEYTDKKGKKKKEQTPQLLQCFMLNLFILRNQRKFFLCLRQRERRI